MQLDDQSARERKIIALTIAGIVVCLAVTLQLSPPRLRANDLSRWNTVHALAHTGSYAIDGFPLGHTKDHVRVEVDGVVHYYSSKPAFMATWVAGLYLPFLRLGLPLERHTMGMILLVANLLPFAAFLWFYWRYLEDAGFSRFARAVAFATAALGTHLTGYTVVLNNHLPAAMGSFFAAYCYWRIRIRGEERVGSFAAMGLASGVAIAHEFSAALLVSGAFAALVVRRPRPTLLVAIPCLALPVGAVFAAEYAATGDPLPNYVHALLGNSRAAYAGSYWASPKGYDLHPDPVLVRAFHMTFGHHGIFSLTPILLLCAGPAWRALRAWPKSDAERAITALCAASAASFALYLFATQNYGGLAQGFRWLMWLIPPWLMTLPQALDSPTFRRRGARWLLLPLLAVSFYSALSCAGGPWSRSWLERLLAR